MQAEVRKQDIIRFLKNTYIFLNVVILLTETLKEVSIMKIISNFQNPVKGNATQQHFTREWRN